MRSFSYGNGSTMIMLDNYGRIRDCYFPFVGLENHISVNMLHRIGVWVDGSFSWTDDGSWTIVTSTDQSYMGHIAMYSPRLNLEIQIDDVLYNEKNIFIRRFVVGNKSDNERVVRLFFNSEFELSSTVKGDTAYYDPQEKAVIHYEGSRAFLLSGMVDGNFINDWSIGIFQIEGKEGTYKDAEDGVLSKNSIEHGRVDSTFSLESKIAANSTSVFMKWMCISDSVSSVISMNADVLYRTPEYLATSARNYWNAWVSRCEWNYYALPASVIDLFVKSQFVIKSHADKNGGIIASGDADMLQGGRDTYCYVWPRDASYVSSAFVSTGDVASARRFFEFCKKIITDEGYMLHKYRPDGSLGSSWHGWIVNNKRELPIQEDETALVLWALWEYWKETRDIEFIESIYDSLIKKAAYFLISYRDPYTGLPHPSYDLWEERFGVHTYSAAATYAGLSAAAQFASILGKERAALDFSHIAEELKEAIIKNLYNEETGLFYRSIMQDSNGNTYKDETVDASASYGVFFFGVMDTNDSRLVKAMEKTKEILTVQTPVGGIARYERDQYYKNENLNQGNPWIITSLWWTQYEIIRACSDDELDSVRRTLEKITKFGGTTGILPEQLDPYTGRPVSASPLAWSHSEYIKTVVMYLKKCKSLGLISEYKNY